MAEDKDVAVTTPSIRGNDAAIPIMLKAAGVVMMMISHDIENCCIHARGMSINKKNKKATCGQQSASKELTNIICNMIY